jgi:hypothetical protein
MRAVLRERLDSLLPAAMRAAGLDMWIVLCQEDDYDPIFPSLIPPYSWCPILQMLVFFDRGDSVERLNLCMTNTGDFYQRLFTGRREQDQWALLCQVVRERDPNRIGINTGSVQWAAGGLTQNLHQQLLAALPPGYASRLESAEALVTHWAATLSPGEVTLMEHVVAVGHAILRHCLSREAITPGVTTTEDLEWHYWQCVADLGLDVSFKPFFDLIRSDAQRALTGPDDTTIRPGDVLHSDVGIRYLGLCSDHQEVAYILAPGDSAPAPGEIAPPSGLRDLLESGTRLQDIYLCEFREGLSGNEILGNILARARDEALPGPRVYSHSLGHFLHQPGPLIGLPWEQERCEGRGEVRLGDNMAFTMELCVNGPIPEWDGQSVTLSLEQDVVFSGANCRILDGRQTAFHLV